MIYLKDSNLHSRLPLRDQAAAILPWEPPESSPFLAFFPDAPCCLGTFFLECIPLINRLHSNPYFRAFSWEIWLKTTEDWCQLLAGICWEAESAGSPCCWGRGLKAGRSPGTRVWEKGSCLHRVSQWQGCRRGHLGTWSSSNCHKKKPALRTSRMIDQERPSAAVVPQSQQIWWKWRCMWLPHIPPKCSPWTQTLLSDAAQTWEHQSLWK